MIHQIVLDAVKPGACDVTLSKVHDGEEESEPSPGSPAIVKILERNRNTSAHKQAYPAGTGEIVFVMDGILFMYRVCHMVNWRL